MLLNGDIGRLETTDSVTSADSYIVVFVPDQFGREGILKRITISDAIPSQNRKVTNIDSAYSILPTDDIIRCTANTFTVSLPAGTTVGDSFTVKNVGIGTVTVDVTGGGTIDGGANITLIQNESATVVADGTNWFEV